MNPNRPWAQLAGGAAGTGRFVLAGVLLAVVVLGWLVLRVQGEARAARRAFALEEGALPLAGLTAPVEILRDGRGIPHIEALQEGDAWLALGFVHAQDRLAQMLWMRRLARGRASELVGESGLAADRMALTLGLGRLADAEAERLPPEVREVLSAYTRGVNLRIARIRSGAAAPPLAWTADAGAIADWQLADCLAVMKLVAFGTSNRLETGLVLDDLIERLGSQLARPFRPTGAGVQGVEIPSELHVEQIAAAGGPGSRDTVAEPGADLVRAIAMGSGSAWVLSGRHTRSGAPILVADFHLPATTPALFYEVQLRGGGVDVAGATIPGVPVLWAGRNLRVAWAAIPAGAVTVDLYKESLREDEGLYKNGSRWSPLEIRREVIRVRTGPAAWREEEWVVRATRHGPLVNDLLHPGGGALPDGSDGRTERQLAAATVPETATPPGADAYPDAREADDAVGRGGAAVEEASGRGRSEAVQRGRREPLAMSWTGLLPGNGIGSLLAVARARDADALLGALADHHEPVVIVVYADDAGSAGMQLAGWLPQRALPTSLVPVPGRLRLFDWRHPIDYTALPAIRFDASKQSRASRVRSWVAVADGPVDDGLSAPGIEWLWRTGERQRRLEQRLEELTSGGRRATLNGKQRTRVEKVDLRAAAELQGDVGGAAGVEVVPALLRLARRAGPLRPEAEEIAEILLRWDGSASPGSRGAAAYQVLTEHLIDTLLRGPFGDPLYTRYLALPGVRPRSVVARILITADRLDAAGGWTDLQRVSAAVRDGLRRTWVSLSHRLGPARVGWTWGGLQAIAFRPFAFGGPFGPPEPSLDRFRLGGDETTLATTEFDRRRTPYDVSRAALYRVAVDLAAPDRMLSALAPGQSEHPGHVHAGDGLGRWLEGRPGLLVTSRLLVEEEGGPRLLLEPES